MISFKLKLLKSIFVLGEKLHLVTFMRRSKLLEVSSMIFRVWLLRMITMTMLNKQRSRQEKSHWLHWFGFSFIKTKLHLNLNSLKGVIEVLGLFISLLNKKEPAQEFIRWGFGDSYTDIKEVIVDHIIDFYESLHSSNSESRDMSVCPLNLLPIDDIVQIRSILIVSVCSYVMPFIVRSRQIIYFLVVALLIEFGNG